MIEPYRQPSDVPHYDKPGQIVDRIQIKWAGVATEKAALQKFIDDYMTRGYRVVSFTVNGNVKGLRDEFTFVFANF